MKYLYGAAVQGIQNFIFQTNELKDIVGASELVEDICTNQFEEILQDVLHTNVSLRNDENAILNAAGNIKYVFESEEACQKVVRVFPKRVVMSAPGITLSQAVETFNSDDEFSLAVNNLESKLRSQRNRPMASTTMGLMGVLRSRKTNLPVVETETVKGKIEYLDAATLAKRYEVEDGQKGNRRNVLKLASMAFGMPKLKYGDVAVNIEDMTDKNDWVAVIHADGNGLGQIVQKIGTDKIKFKAFSKKLDAATKKAAVDAFDDVAKKYEWDVIPIRPIVIGGDDLTVVCRADLALDYVTSFMGYFEKYTVFDELEGVFLNDEKKLTACAGIAYVKSSYPFYFAYELAESLCTRAKKDAKKGLKQVNGKMALPNTCLMFHKVQDSFVESFDDIAERELTPQDGISFEYGPYYLSATEAHGEKRWTIDEFKKSVGLIGGEVLKDAKKGNAVKSHLRNWLTLLHDNAGLADQKRLRLIELLTTKNQDDELLLEFVKKVTYSTRNVFKTPVYDILAIHTINSQCTKKSEDKK